MSLHRFKSTLLAASAVDLPSPIPPPSSSDDDALPRRPPKSSLSRQLQRLGLPDDTVTSSLAAPARSNRVPAGDGEDPEEQGGESEEDCNDGVRDDVRFLRRQREPSTSAAVVTAGPYEPLLLSDPGELPIIEVPASINCRLLPHQRDGVKFLYGLYRRNHGGVLGDDMGLGKTIQTIAFLAAIIAKDNGSASEASGKTVGPVLILCPTSVIRNWEKEFEEWSELSVAIYHGPNRELVLEKIATRGVEVLITSFDTFRIHGKNLCAVQWEVVIVDEAHRLKNEKSKLYGACLELSTLKRFGLTGTIMQNKMLELFNLFDWVVPGCLGEREHFRQFYDEPLKQGQRLSAPERFVEVADERKKHLVSVLRKYLLRRTKEETIGHLMLGKEDNIVFCKMSDLQKRVYRRMLQQPDIQILINKDLPCSCGSPLTQVECCNKTAPDGVIWSYLHKDNPGGCAYCPFCLVLPCLVKLQQISNHLELIKPNPKDDIEKQKKDTELAAAVFDVDIDLVDGRSKSENFMGLSDVEHCGKMRALEKLLSLWISQGDKVLLFSYTVRMLDILENLLIRKGYCFSRFDGSTPMNARQLLVDEFNRSPSKQVFLISTRAGNLGVNLVSANRVVIFDPSWNPAQDMQAQDRSFRFGQKRHVTVFRLLAAGSLEELVYTRQIYKQQLSNIAVSGKIEKRYFEGVQDNKKFQGELFGVANLFRDLSDKLFTSEIIEMHQEHGNKSVGENEAVRGTGGYNHDAIDERRLCGDSTTNEGEAKMDGLGIVYALRNEDVVNMGKGKSDSSVVHDDAGTGRQPAGARCNDSESRPTNSGEIRSSALLKRQEFRRIASYMNMGELEFSKWLLSALPAERQKLLEGYKKKPKTEPQKLLEGYKKKPKTLKEN